MKIFLQDYETCSHPMGFTLKIVLLSTWGDKYYIGLNGIEIFDINGNEISSNKMSLYRIAAEPPSVRFYYFFNYIFKIDKLLKRNAK